jgi:sRNA-binding regulator protein Hfq
MNPNITHETATDRMTSASMGTRRPQHFQSSGSVKPRFVAKGHDAQLLDAQTNGNLTEITTQSGERFVGTITRRDKYTISLACPGCPAGDYIIYKHAIETVLIHKTAKAA